jgi:cellulose synthase (UDP-forming)
MAWPFVATFIVLLLGVATAAWRYAFEPGVTSVMLVVGLWALFNLLIAGAALGVVTERRELRRHPRLAVARRGTIAFDGYTANAGIENVSAGGCAIRVGAREFAENSLRLGKSRGRLTIQGAACPSETRTLDVVRTRANWDGDSVVIGLKFDVVTAVDYFVLADLMYGDADALAAFLAKRRKHMGILRGTVVFLRWSACEPVRAFYYLFARKHRQNVARAMSVAAAQARPAISVNGAVNQGAAAGRHTAEAFGPPVVESPSISPGVSAAGSDVSVEGASGLADSAAGSFGDANALRVSGP